MIRLCSELIDDQDVVAMFKVLNDIIARNHKIVLRWYSTSASCFCVNKAWLQLSRMFCVWSLREAVRLILWHDQCSISWPEIWSWRVCVIIEHCQITIQNESENADTERESIEELTWKIFLYEWYHAHSSWYSLLDHKLYSSTRKKLQNEIMKVIWEHSTLIMCAIWWTWLED